MQILILGNGFDIEHKLPTQYKDFLSFVKEYLDLYNNENIELGIEAIGDGVKKDFYKSIVVGEKKEIGNLLFESLKNNKWIEYFLKNQTYIKENWIDFESEISKIVILLEKVRDAYEKDAIFMNEQIAPSKAMNAFYKEMYSDKEGKISMKLSKNNYMNEKLSCRHSSMNQKSRISMWTRSFKWYASTQILLN